MAIASLVLCRQHIIGHQFVGDIEVGSIPGKLLLKGLDGILDFSELGLALFEHVQLLQQLSDALVFVVKFETFLCNENGIIHSLRSGKKIGITVNRFRIRDTRPPPV